MRLQSQNEDLVTQNIKLLIKHIIPPLSSSDLFLENCILSLVGIIHARVSSSFLKDENLIKDALFKKIEEQNDEKSQPAKQAAKRLNDLFYLFGKSESFSNKLSVLLLLSKLSGWKNELVFLKTVPLDSIFSPKNEKMMKLPMPLHMMDPFLKNTVFPSLKSQPKQKETHSSLNLSPQHPSSSLKTKTMGYSSDFPSNLEENERGFLHKCSWMKIDDEMNEDQIIRDVLCAFQGIEGSVVQFSQESDGFCLLTESIQKTIGMRELVNRLGEIGWYFSSVSNFLEEARMLNKGLVHQAFCSGVKEELRDYYRMISVMENTRESTLSSQNKRNPGKKSLNLRKLLLWTFEPLECLKWLNFICDEVSTLKGSQMLSVLSSHSNQGSLAIQQLMNRLLTTALSPFVSFIKNWVCIGDLFDPMEEFFVSTNRDSSGDSFWFEKFQVVPKNIPNLISHEIAQKLLQTGKSMVFLRKHSDDEKGWRVQERALVPQMLLPRKFNAKSTCGCFQEWVEVYSQEINKRLVDMLVTKFKLYTHLDTIRKFILFGQGDFIQYLMDILFPVLSKSAMELHVHSFASHLETSIRSSNAQFLNSEIQSRIQIRLLEGRKGGENGWDVFSLEYRLEQPLSTIIHRKASESYVKLFNFLWRAKSMEFLLNSTWTKHMKSIGKFQSDKKLEKITKTCQIIRHQMFHFASSFLSYLMVEVIEGEFHRFIQKCHKASSFDQIIIEHDAFIETLIKKSMLSNENASLFKCVITIFEYIHRFRSTQDQLWALIKERNQRAKDSEEWISKRQAKNIVYIPHEEEEELEERIKEREEMVKEYEEHFDDLIKRIKESWASFRNSLDEMQGLIGKGDSFKLLAIKLDFNEFYKNSKEKAELRKTKERDQRRKEDEENQKRKEEHQKRIKEEILSQKNTNRDRNPEFKGVEAKEINIGFKEIIGGRESSKKGGVGRGIYSGKEETGNKYLKHLSQIEKKEKEAREPERIESYEEIIQKETLRHFYPYEPIKKEPKGGSSYKRKGSHPPGWPET